MLIFTKQLEKGKRFAFAFIESTAEKITNHFAAMLMKASHFHPAI